FDPHRAVEYVRRHLHVDMQEEWRSEFATALFFADECAESIEIWEMVLKDHAKRPKSDHFRDGSSLEFYFIAACYAKLGKRNNAQVWLGRGDDWMRKYYPEDPALLRLREMAVSVVEESDAAAAAVAQ